MNAWVALGSNVGDRLAHLATAVDGMMRAGLDVCRVSGVYETHPVEVTDQRPFLNAVAEIETEMGPFALLDVLQELERQGGRKRDRPKGPRTIDLDLLLYGDWVIGSHRLTVPHPAMSERAFVLMPSMDLDPERLVPGSGGKSLRYLTDRCRDDVSRPRRLSLMLRQD